jgi:mannose-6-phosphate isomerase-like protein (cupin superfamily)
MTYPVIAGFILGIKFVIGMESIYELENILSTLDKDEYFVDFLNTKSLEAGIISLRVNQNDTQTSHPIDELYYVIEGEGYLQIEGKDHRVHKGTTIFVPANVNHNFRGNQVDLIVLYIFPKA